jgi:hypothetical protein
VCPEQGTRTGLTGAGDAQYPEKLSRSLSGQARRTGSCCGRNPDCELWILKPMPNPRMGSPCIREFCLALIC